MALKEFLKEAMPDSWLKKLFLLFLSPLGAVLSAWGSGLLLPFLKGIDSLLLLRTIGAISGLTVVLVAYICWLLYKLKKKNDELNDEDRLIKKLHTNSLEILRAIAVFEPPFDNNYRSIPLSDLAATKNLGFTSQEITYHLDQLKSAHCININPLNDVSLTPKGRALLYEKKLLC